MSFYAGLIVLVLLTAITAAALSPPTLTCERRIQIAAPPARVWRLLDDPQAWPGWMAPLSGARFRLEGPVTGAGATCIWTEDAGHASGNLRIVDTDEPHEIVIQARTRGTLDLNGAGVAGLRAVDGGTRLTVRVVADLPFGVRLAAPVLRPGRRLGGIVDASLARLALAAAPRPVASQP